MGSSMRSRSRSSWGVEDVFARSASSQSPRERIEDDEEALRFAALEKLPTYDRLRTSIFTQTMEENGEMNVDYRQVNVRKLGFIERQAFIDRLIKVADQDNEKFLTKLRNRIDRVGIQLPTVEVRFQNLTVDADCYVGTRALPTLWNTARNLVEYMLAMVGLSLTKKTNLTILNDASGILKPSRMTLLLGPPGSGKTTLLLALAGKLDSGLKVRGEITYNGHRLDEFVPQKTSAYISQRDLHVGEMTVRETLDFSARCHGVGDRLDLLTELARREKQAGIFPEPDVDLFMKATAMEGVKSSLQTDYILKILGLDVCGDTIVGDDMRRGISGGQKKRVTTALGKPQAVISEEAFEEMQARENGTEQGHNRKPSRSRRGSSSDDNTTVEMQIRRMSNQSTSIEGIDQLGLETATGVPPKRGMILPFDALAMSFEDVNYFVDMPAELRERVTEDRLQLLQDVTGAFRPGVLTALMGVSGAGKTTLMDVLAGRKTGGYMEGHIRISGFPKKQETFTRISGYCEQNDIHSPQVTVRESLLYSAFLRLRKDVDKETRFAFVDEVMELVELDNLRDALVGLPGVTGLSTEQRKRLTIAVELVANPSIIFMDEPTSGLDARAAAIVMRTVRNTVDTGRTVVCTIHQPSIDIFEAFDELLLMKRGGKVIFFGPLGQNSHKVVEYFEAIPGVPKIKDKYNPATWMLEVSSTAAEHGLGIDFAEHYKNCSLYNKNRALVKELNIPSPGAKDLYFSTQYSQSFFKQFHSCLWKQWWTYWRSPHYNAVRYSFTFVCALVLGTIFWKVGTKRDNNIVLFTVAGALFSAVIFLGVNNCSTVQPVVGVERTVFYRERGAGMYSALPYALAQVVIELPYILGQTAMYTPIVYSMFHFEWTTKKFAWFFFLNYFTFLYFTYYGMMIVSITPNQQVASIVAGAFYSVFSLFSGFFIPKPRIPKWWIWYYWICPVAWTVYGLIASQYGDVTDPLEVLGEGTKPLNKFVEDYFGYRYDFLGAVAGALVGFSVLFASVFALGIKVLNFQQR